MEICAVDYPPASFILTYGYQDCITIDPQIRSGKPCIKGTRIAVADVLDYLGGGMTAQEILEDFPDLTGESIQACLTFAAERERRLMVAA